MPKPPNSSCHFIQDSARWTDTATDNLIDVQGECWHSNPQTGREPYQPIDRHYEFSMHLARALSVLSPKEQLRLAKVLGHSSVGECVDALWYLCTFEASEDPDSQPPETPMDNSGENRGSQAWNGAQPESRNGAQPETNAHHVQPETRPSSAQHPQQNEDPSWVSWMQQGWASTPTPVASPSLSVQEPPWNAPEPSPSLQAPKDEPLTSHKRARAPTQKVLGGGLSYYDAYESDESPRSQARARASPKPRKKGKNIKDSSPPVFGDSEGSMIQKIPKITGSKTPRKRLTFKQRPYPATEASASVFRALHVGDGGPKLPHVAPSRSSFRDRVWDLLYESEKTQIVSEQMGASEGVKRLLARRASTLGCDIHEIPDDDSWDIGMKLSQNKSSSEPLAEPRKCCLCMRDGTVTTKHNYYCRRCQLIYRAIHRKKLQPDWQKALAKAARTSGESSKNHAAVATGSKHSDEDAEAPADMGTPADMSTPTIP